MKFILFADDTNIICADDNLEQLLASVTVELDKLKIWFNTNKLSLNLNKTKIMLFSNRKCNIPVKIVIDDTLIEKVQQNTFLGIIIDDKISWKPHISYLRTKVAKCVGMMKRSCTLLNTNARLLLYHSFIMSYLYYCAEIWGNCYKTHLQPLITLQKKAIRIVSGVHYRHHSNPLFVELEELKLQDVINSKTAQIMFRASQYSLPPNIQNLFRDRDAHHSYTLRGIKNKYLPKFRTTLKSMCISVRGVKLWNDLADELKTCPNIIHFKHLFKKNVLKKYVEDRE